MVRCEEAPDDVWDDILDLHCPDQDGCIAVLRVYIDASTRDDSGLLSVAGYLFESSRVRRFRQRWRDTFGTENFSWADLVARRKAFKHLQGKENNPEHSRLIAAGVSIVREHVIAGTIVSCWKQDVERFGPTWIKGFGHAYSIAGHMAMAGMGLWAKRHNYRGGISYVIEAGDDGYDQLDHLLSYASKSPEVADFYQWHGHSTTPKTPFSPFHAPDLLAWEWGKFMAETGVERKRLMRLSLVNLLIHRLDSYSFQHLSGDPFLRFFNQIHDLGVEQLQEDRAAVSSVSSMDVSEAVQSSEPIAPVEDQK